MRRMRCWAALLCGMLAAAPAVADQKILFSGYGPAGWGLWTTTADGQLQKLYDGEFRGPVAAAGTLAWAAPSGRIYTRSTTDPDAPAQVVDGLPLPCGQPTLSPDARTLVVACFRFSNRQDDGSFYRIDLTDRSVSALMDAPGLQKSAVFSPDGQRLAFVSGFRLSAERVIEHIWVMNADGTDAVAVADSSDINIDPTWIDNDTLVFSSDQGGNGVQLWHATLSTGKMRALTTGPSDLEGGANAAGQVAYVGETAGDFGLMLLEAGASQPRHLAVTAEDGLEAAHDPVWTTEY